MEVVEVEGCVVLTSQCSDGPGCLAPGRREDWALTETWPRCRPGQVSSSGWEKAGGGTIVTELAEQRGYLYPVKSPAPVNTQIMPIKTAGMFRDFLRHLAD